MSWHQCIGKNVSSYRNSSNEILLVFSEILEKSTTRDLNESLKNIFDRIVALPLRSAANPNKPVKDSTARDHHKNRQERMLTLYEK